MFKRSARTTLLFSLTATLAAVSGPEGRWEGTAATMHGAIPLEVEIRQHDGVWSGRGTAGGTLDEQAPDLSEVRIQGDSVWIGIPIMTNVGEATMILAGAIDGSVMQGTFETAMDNGMAPMAGTWRLEATDGN